MTIKIEVTQEDIDNGARSDAEFCPIARAARRQGLEWYVTPRYIYDRDKDRNLKLPEEARNFIDFFDCHIAVEPFSFEVET